MDSNPKEHKDQPSLTLMWEDHQRRESANKKDTNRLEGIDHFPPCLMTQMPQEPFLEFVAVREMTAWKHGDSTAKGVGPNVPKYATLMHIKNTQHASVIPDALQKAFFKNLLDLPPELMTNLTAQKRIRPNRTWSALQVKQQDDD